MRSTPRTAEARQASAPLTAEPLLAVDGLVTTFATGDGEVLAVNDVSFAIAPGEALGVVGESGSGKSQIFMSVMGLLAANGRARGSVRFAGREILNLSPKQLNDVRGARMAMIFQDPMTSLNPFLRVGTQLIEVLETHKAMSGKAAREAAIEFLDRVRIPEPRRRFDMYPHELSGGMRQRVMIAMALLCGPELLIADEPTTALDVTIQAQILRLIGELRRDFNTAVILITHDLGVVAGLCDRVLVMYGGRIVESGPVRDIYYDPQHPYTKGLLHSMPRLDEVRGDALRTIAGQPPNLQYLPSGCAFRDRCAYRFETCAEVVPPLRGIAPGRAKACHLERL